MGTTHPVSRTAWRCFSELLATLLSASAALEQSCLPRPERITLSRPATPSFWTTMPLFSSSQHVRLTMAITTGSTSVSQLMLRHAVSAATSACTAPAAPSALRFSASRAR